MRDVLKCVVSPFYLTDELIKINRFKEEDFVWSSDEKYAHLEIIMTEATACLRFLVPFALLAQDFRNMDIYKRPLRSENFVFEIGFYILTGVLSGLYLRSRR